MIPLLFSLMIFVPLQFVSAQSPPPPNLLIYGAGSVEVNTQINEFENLKAGKPIQGSVMITHDANSSVDVYSFRLGNKPLKVAFVQSVKMSVGSPIEISIYSFQLEGMTQGNHNLPPIKVKVGSKVYASPTLSLQINGP